MCSTRSKAASGSYGTSKLDRRTQGKIMDKKIKRIKKTVEKDSAKEISQIKDLQKADKKRDKVVERAEKINKKSQ